jgi:hypothetical protein
MVDNQGTDTSQSANEMFDESVFTDAPQTEATESSVDNTLTPTDAFTTQTGEEAPEAAPSETQEQPQPLEAKNDDTRFQYWQSQAAQKDNQIQQMQQQMQQAQQQMQQPQAQPEPEVQEFPPPPAKPSKPRNFNRQEAYEDSSSESARYLDEVDDWRDKIDEYNSLKNQYDNALVREKMEAMEEEKAQAQRVRDAQRQQASQLKEVDGLMQGNYGMTPEESRDFIQKMSDPKSISIDNLVKLYRLQNGQGNAAPAQGQPAQPSSTFQQAQRAQQVPQPMGVQPTAGNTTAPAEDQIMDNMISDFKSKNPW